MLPLVFDEDNVKSFGFLGNVVTNVVDVILLTLDFVCSGIKQ